MSTYDNFLWSADRLYIMDNHRLAPWCWWQHLPEQERWAYVHIDRHFDSLWSSFNPWPNNSTDEHRRDLEAFRTATISESGERLHLYRWDTVTTTLWSLHGSVIADSYFATGGEGDEPPFLHAKHVSPWKLPGQLDWLAGSEGSPRPTCIVDIDIDYFSRHDLDGACGPLFSRAYLRSIGQAVQKGLANGRFGVVTIALSPETTGSWALAEELLDLLLSPVAAYAEFGLGAP